MRFVLEVDVEDSTAVEELGRILRYWAGNLKHYDLSALATETVYDSRYTSVGSWNSTPGAA